MDVRAAGATQILDRRGTDCRFLVRAEPLQVWQGGLPRGAAGVQGMTSGSALRKLSIAGESETSILRYRVATGQRVAAVLLAITVTCMAAARYA